MESAHIQQKNEALFVSVNFAVMARVHGRAMAMRAEQLDRAGLFMICKDYVRPWTIFEIELALGEGEQPLRAIVTASFVERTWDGYGIGAQISCLSSAAQARWDSYYRQALSDSTPGYSATFQLAKFLKQQHVVTISGALSDGVRDALREVGVEVTTVYTADEALRLTRNGKADLLVISPADDRYEALEVCQKLRAENRPPLVLVLLDEDTVHRFDGSLFSGATQVVYRACSQATLLMRILSYLQDPQHQYAADAAFSLDTVVVPRSFSALISQWSESFVSLFSQARSGL